MHLHSKKGHDLRLDNAPSTTLDTVKPSKYIKLHPKNFLGIKPKLLVSEGDSVKQGQPIYFDKKQPDIMHTTSMPGIVDQIVYGERRSIESINIKVESSKDEACFSSYDADKIQGANKEKIIKDLCISGCWSYIRKRPFSKVPSPKRSPDAIFITSISTSPYATSLKVIHDNIDIVDLQAGIDALFCLGGMPIHMVLPHTVSYPAFNSLKNINMHTFSGPHPSGNVGYHIANIHPIEKTTESKN